jgi:hypothetical protein
MTIGAGWAEGAWIDASWVVGAWAPVTASKTIGGTSQLEAFSSTGGLDVTGNKTVGGVSQLEAFASTGGLDVTGSQTIGGVSQLEAFASSGGIDVLLPKTVGGTSQLEAFTSSGTIDSGTPAATDQPSGGYGWVRYEQEQLRRKAGKKAAQRKRRKARKIKDEIDRQLALVERGIEEKDARVSELTRLTKLVDQNRGMVSEAQDKKLDAIADKAIETYSIASMEHLERAIKHSREEQLFFELATMILLEQ